MSLDKFLKLKVWIDRYIDAMVAAKAEPMAVWVRPEQKKLLAEHGIRTHYRGIEIKTVKD